MKCPITPLGDKIVLIAQEEEEQMYGSIVIPDTGKEKPEVGIIQAVGPGRYTTNGTLIENNLEVGQKVLVPKFGAQIARIENQSYIIASESDVLGIIK
jgi:chaperonin GroES|tara:strand:- start:190 stop:483 length:294 start_codon:yes stop_codon:yes gene_type:complete